MAKLKAPLLSLGASGQIGKSLVFFNWKGLDVAREFVIPANPDTTLQQTQRGYLKSMVDQIHGAEANATHPMNAADKAAYALLGSLEPTPRTWFNTIIKMGIDLKVAALHWGVFHYSSISQGASTITLDIWISATDTITACKIYWGTSKSALINSANGTMLAGDHFNADCTGLTAGNKYYFQIRCTAPATSVGLNTGIYHLTKT